MGQVPALSSPVHQIHTAHSTSSRHGSKHGVLWDGQRDGQGLPPSTWPQAYSHPPGWKVPWALAPRSSGAAPARKGDTKVMENAVCVGLGKLRCHLS